MPKIGPLTPKLPKPPLPDRIRSVEENVPKCGRQINEEIVKAEAKLRALKPIEAVWLDYDSDTDRHGEPTAIHYIGFAKHEGKWRLLYSVVDPQDPESSTNHPLADTQLETRVNAAIHAPKLYEKIVEKKEGFIAKANETISVLNAFNEMQ